MVLKLIIKRNEKKLKNLQSEQKIEETKNKIDEDLDDELNRYKFEGIVSHKSFKKNMKNDNNLESLKNKLKDLEHQRNHAFENDKFGNDDEKKEYDDSKKYT